MDDWLEWLQERRLMLALVAVVGLAGLLFWNDRPVAQRPGVLAPAEPLQTEPAPGNPWSHRGFKLTSLAQFQLKARVLGRERYRFDRGADLSPVDLALGWGPMSDTRVLEAFTIRQQDRFYYWSAAHMPIPAGEVISHSANMHLIPATEALGKRLLGARVGQLVELRGQLIRAEGKDGFTWVSSLTRADSGEGACEVIWVEEARVADR
ncbi:MAG: hypothetical protein HGB30_02785 [Holophagaceae bacterium]|nr:hypothetical protein [Holophagaceae bacterium]